MQSYLLMFAPRQTMYSPVSRQVRVHHNSQKANCSLSDLETQMYAIIALKTLNG